VPIDLVAGGAGGGVLLLALLGAALFVLRGKVLSDLSLLDRAKAYMDDVERPGPSAEAVIARTKNIRSSLAELLEDARGELKRVTAVVDAGSEQEIDQEEDRIFLQNSATCLEEAEAVGDNLLEKVESVDYECVKYTSYKKVAEGLLAKIEALEIADMPLPDESDSDSDQGEPSKAIPGISTPNKIAPSTPVSDRDLEAGKGKSDNEDSVEALKSAEIAEARKLLEKLASSSKFCGEAVQAAEVLAAEAEKELDDLKTTQLEAFRRSLLQIRSPHQREIEAEAAECRANEARASAAAREARKAATEALGSYRQGQSTHAVVAAEVKDLKRLFASLEADFPRGFALHLDLSTRLKLFDAPLDEASNLVRLLQVESGKAEEAALEADKFLDECATVRQAAEAATASDNRGPRHSLKSAAALTRCGTAAEGARMYANACMQYARKEGEILAPWATEAATLKSRAAASASGDGPTPDDLTSIVISSKEAALELRQEGMKLGVLVRGCDCEGPLDECRILLEETVHEKEMIAELDLNPALLDKCVALIEEAHVAIVNAERHGSDLADMQARLRDAQESIESAVLGVNGANTLVQTAFEKGGADQGQAMWNAFQESHRTVRVEVENSRQLREECAGPIGDLGLALQRDTSKAVDLCTEALEVIDEARAAFMNPPEMVKACETLLDTITDKVRALGEQAKSAKKCVKSMQADIKAAAEAASKCESIDMFVLTKFAEDEDVYESPEYADFKQSVMKAQDAADLAEASASYATKATADLDRLANAASADVDTMKVLLDDARAAEVSNDAHAVSSAFEQGKRVLDALTERANEAAKLFYTASACHRCKSEAEFALNEAKMKRTWLVAGELVKKKAAESNLSPLGSSFKRAAKNALLSSKLAMRPSPER